MKKLITLTLLLLSVSLSTEADSTEFHHHHHGGVHIGFIESRELSIDTIGQEFNVVYRTYFADTVDIPVLVKLALPAIPDAEPLPSEAPPFFTFPGSGNEITGSYVSGDSIIDSLTVSFNKINLPFYYQVLELQVWDSAGEHLLTSTKFMVYFTPWNTIEVWNDFDFENLPRIWMNHTNSHEDRIYFHKDSLPDTDLTFEEFINDSVPKSYYSPEGLGYLIPIHYIDDESELMMRRDDGCPGSQKKWVGVVSGRIMANVLNDFDDGSQGSEQFTDINIAGIKVTVMQRESSWLRTDKELVTTYTNNQGEFSVSVNRCFRGGVGNELELYIIVESANSSNSVIVRQRSGRVRKEAVSKHVYWAYNSGQQSNLNMGSFWPSTSSLKPQLLHWANRCRTFVNQELFGHMPTLGSSSKPLEIMIHPIGPDWGGVFIPNGQKAAALATMAILGLLPPGVIASTIITNKDGIYIGGNSELNEDLMYHEFGHYLMWYLQDESWANVLDASFADHSFYYNCDNPKIAWTEGWAGGIGAIFDIAFRDDDGEAGLDAFETEENFIIVDNIERRTVLNGWLTERLLLNVRHGNAPGQDIQVTNSVTHGFVSEMNIACAILDLYDGEGKGNILESMAAEEHDDRENLNLPPGPGNPPQDLVSLTFAQICKPLLNNQGQGYFSNVVIQDATHYAYELARSLPCELRAQVFPIWRFNRIRDFEDPPTQLTSTDVIRIPNWIETELFKYTGRNADNDLGTFLKLDGTYGQIYNVDVPVINNNRGSFNVVIPPHGGGEYIIDPLLVTDGESLRFNNNLNSNWINGSDPNPTSSTLTAYFCSNETRFNEGGRLVVGDWDSTSGRFANVHIGKGSTVVLEGGTTVSELVINNKSKLIIDEGGVLEVHPGARIILNGTNAVLEVRGEIRMMENADFTVEGGAQGFGYIKFHKDRNDFTPKLVTGMGNNNIALEGDGASHRLIEITGEEGWFVPNHFTDVSISNCIVTLGTGSRMTMENSNKLTITNVEMKKIEGQERHKGLYVWSWGMYSEIDNLTVKDGIQGIYYYPINDDKDHSDLKVRYAVKTHVVKNSRFEDNITGIKSIRVPVWMINNEFDGYHTHGVRTYGSLGRNMYLLDNIFDNSGSSPSTLDTGLSYWGGMLGRNIAP